MVYFFNDYENFSAEKYLKFLPPKRYEKFKKIKKKIDADNCVVAYLILAYALKQNGIPDFDIVIGENGKPFLSGKDKYFNISHCSDGVAVVIDENPVGTDIQEITEFRERIAKRFFSEDENKRIAVSKNKSEIFTRLWTLKECAIKCDGKSLANLKDFSFENYENFFEKYGKKFSCLTQKNVLISICGNKYFNEIKTISTEDFYETFISR